MHRPGVALFAALVLIASGCAPAATGTPAPTPTSAGTPSATPPQAETTLTFTSLAPWTPIFHPVRMELPTQFMVFNLLYNTLVKVDKDSKTIVPDLADTWEVSPDATVLTFHLHPGVTWHDGQPLTAKDVVYTVTWAAQNADAYVGFAPAWPHVKGAASIKGTTNPLSGIEAIDDLTVRITLETPNAEFLRSLPDMQNAIMPEHILRDLTAAEAEKVPFSTGTPGVTIGTGPYKLMRFVPDQLVETEANPDYFKGRPKIDRMIYKIFADPATALAQLESGDLDLAFRVSASEFDRLSRISTLNVISTTDTGIVRMAPRIDGDLFKDKRVRQAMYYAINRKAIVESALNGQGKVLIGPPGFSEYEDLNRYKNDPVKAKALLQDASFDFSKTVRIIYDQNAPGFQEVLPLIQQDLQAVGMKVELMPLDSAAWVDASVNPEKRRDWDINMEKGGSEGLTPDRTAQYFNCKNPTFETGYQNCDMMALFANGRSFSDPQKRDEIYHQIARILNEDVPFLYLWSPNLLTVATKRLGGGFAVHRNERESAMGADTWTLEP